MRTAGFSFLIALGASACGGSEGSPGEGVGIRGVVDYGGTQEGPLRIAVFTSFPPRGSPLAQTRIEAPRFPQEYFIDGVPEGRYFVLGILDVDTTDGERYRPSLDPGGAFGSYLAPMNVSVDSVLGADGVDVELQDPVLDSPWIRPTYR